MSLNMIKFLVLLLFPIISYAVPKDYIPPLAYTYVPMLNQQIKDRWGNLKDRSILAGQGEQESCLSLTNKKCWNPLVELKTSREYGFSVFQLTVAYNKDGTERFNTFNDVKKLDKSLNSWKWEDRFNPTKQFLAAVLMDKSIYDKLPSDIQEEQNRMAFTLAAYNGGYGGIIFQDRKLCANIKTCNKNLWFGNVELYSMKQKTKLPGYGLDFFTINREYPKNILTIRKFKYEKLMKD